MRMDPLQYLHDEVESRRQQGLLSPIHVLDGPQQARSSFDRRQVVNLSSNNYLGLTTHPRLRARALEAVERYGTGSGSVRALVDFLQDRGRPFIFSTSHPPSAVAASIAALDVLLEEPGLIERLWENTRFFKAGLRAALGGGLWAAV